MSSNKASTQVFLNSIRSYLEDMYIFRYIHLISPNKILLIEPLGRLQSCNRSVDMILSCLISGCCNKYTTDWVV